MYLEFLTKKTVSLIVTVFLLVTCCFFLVRLLPGNPFDEGRFSSALIQESMERKYGLDKPILIQYSNYLSKLISKGDLGPSLKYPSRNVNQIISEALPVSIIIGLMAFLLAGFLGIAAGIFMGLDEDLSLSKFFELITILFLSMPSFIFAATFITIFGIWFKLLPVALWEGPEYAILPVLSLSLAPFAYITRVTASSVKETFNKSFVRTAIVKGLSKKDVIFKHILPNSLLPIITVMGPILAMLVTGSFVVEYVFALPGLGKYFITAFSNRDYFLVIGVVLVFALILIAVNTIIDLLVKVIDPRQN
ncbi:MAG: ABC transporter permease [Candidatus Caenarcaniphilales bacterium]|jgi:oligopeptide transport system permease protein|nr:ABC transporter permease [Candidatus Caenarcaniphilales bacterium]